MKTRHPRFKYIFLWLDISAFTVSFFCALHLTMPEFWAASRENLYFCINHIFSYFIVLAIFIISFRYNTLYLRNVLITHYRQFVLVIKSLLGGSITSLILLAIFNMEYLALYGKQQVTYFFLLSLILSILFRVILGKTILTYFLRKGFYSQRVLIIGGDRAGRHTAESLMNDKFIKFQVAGFLDDYKKEGEKIYEGFRNLGKLEDLERVVNEHHVNEILIAIDNAPYSRLIYIVEKCLETGRPVKIYSDLLWVVADRMKVEYYSNIPVVSLSQHPLTGTAWTDKRTFDIILSLFAIVILSPLFLAIAIGIKLSSKGPVIFKQVRIGKNGRPFDFYKFRSMHMGTDDSRHKEYVTDFIKDKTRSDETNINVFKIKDDPRIFKFGKFIRKTSLDEFPQFFNVLKGDMSLVGARPCLPYEWDYYREWHKNRLNVVPGCTGLWQALGRSSVSFEEMVILDLYYISNMSLWFDFKIVLQTFPVIFLGKGGY